MKTKNFDPKKKVFIIAEIGNNHEGNFQIAKKLINLAAKAGVDAVKFQTFKTEEFVRVEDFKRFNQLKKFELSYDQFEKLKNLSHKKKIKFISTPLDIHSSIFLNKHADIIKIASSDNNFFPLIDKVLKSKKPIIISTGMTNMLQVKQLLKYIEKKIGKRGCEKRVYLLHCVTSYPVENHFANLNSIKYLIKNTKQIIGYSDHTIGNEACIAAVAMGARIIEKHFTIDKNFSNFRDHALSADYIDLKKLVLSIRKVEKQIGKFNKNIQFPEKKLIQKVRRSAYAKKNIFISEKINSDNVIFLRPSASKSFMHIKKILGKRVNKFFLKNKVIK
ncbi:N-acetylneuraminate synthase family protein [Candidatus Pelagibacter bacterium]|nr:N-acetylneuraminate synthase family protein [Candidatus Pelagibacter bacterium]